MKARRERHRLVLKLLDECGQVVMFSVLIVANLTLWDSGEVEAALSPLPGAAWWRWVGFAFGVLFLPVACRGAVHAWRAWRGAPDRDPVA
ncbi:hypothetical protein H4W23_16770 [Streptomyces gardneri]|uniref:hypothetical protein n=1 Tax=Streptomyces gardneri TaxID=66892 RepID=UPI0012666BB9|nr:hypothetical protein [Streptomyces gardneri]QPK46120.1 hypothetical protein H4W23_16770 [Streptomyces gardneri]WRK37486.1 hypothetical protein U0M97_16855 [Streptomyces venezuelae]